MVRLKSGNRDRYQCNNNGAAKKRNSILMPSKSLFETLDEDLSVNSLENNVSKKIVHRENLLERIEEIFSGNEGRDENEVSALLQELHIVSIGIVDAIIDVDSLKLCVDEKKCSPTRHQIAPTQQVLGKTTFLWNGENYLLKMLTDLQHTSPLTLLKDASNFGLHTFYRNPFLLPFDVDKMVTFQIIPGDSLHDENAMYTVPWQTNIANIKRASRRILNEEKMSPHEAQKAIEVSKMNRDSGANMIELTIYPTPLLNFKGLKDVVDSPKLTYDDALVVYHTWTFICADASYQYSIQNFQITKTKLFKVVRDELGGLIFHFKQYASGTRKIAFPVLLITTLYPIILRHLLKLELLRIKSSEPLTGIKAWLLSTVSRCFRMSGAKINVELLKFQNSTESTSSDYCFLHKSMSMNNLSIRDSTNDSLNSHERETIAYEPNVSKCNSRHKTLVSEPLLEGYSPVPIRCIVSITEGDFMMRIIQGVPEEILPGEKIRIGHPFHSINYTVCAKKDESIPFTGRQICITEPFDYSPLLHEEFKKLDDTIEVLHDPLYRMKQKKVQESKFHPMKSLTVLDSGSQDAFEKERQQLLIGKGERKRTPLTFAKLRVWKLVPEELDRRLQWRRDFDNGNIPWYVLDADSVNCRHFRVQQTFSEIEENCFDSITEPYHKIHQQRLLYFEKVHLDDIISETYITVCNWHPVSSSIDIFKWAKLARGMKFLSRVKNSNHEVDMAFLRHSENRTLDFTKFKSVLLDMATIKFPSSRYHSTVS